MLGNFSKGKPPVHARDAAEYVVMKMQQQVWDDLRKQNVVISRDFVRTLRDRLTRDGKPIDFENVWARASDIENWLRETGATSFGELDKAPTLREGITKKWVEWRDEWQKEASKGNYLHTIADPVLREHILDTAPEPMTKVFFACHGKSARELNIGDTASFYTRSGQPIFSALVTDRNGKGKQYTATPKVQSSSKSSNLTNFDFSDEPFLGWNGGVVDGKELRGLSDVMGAYFTKADAAEIAKNFDNIVFQGEFVNNSVKLLRHMRSNGYDFSVGPSKDRNQIDVKLQSGENVNVRVFDPAQNGRFVGRVYDSYNHYYWDMHGTKEQKAKMSVSPEETAMLLDYVMGHKNGRIVKAASTPSSEVRIDGVNKKHIFVAPTADRYASIVFRDKEDAKTYIEKAIKESTDFVRDEFKVDELQALIDSGLDDDNVLITGKDFQAKLEKLYSKDDVIREAQERAAMMAIHSKDGGKEYLISVRDAIVGDYENGFNPAFVVDHMNETERGNDRNAMMAALKTVNYDLDKLKGNAFGVNAMKDQLIRFDPETAKGIDEVDHPMLKHALKTVQDTLKAGNFKGIDGKKDPDVLIDENGVIQWKANRPLRKKGQYQTISGEIGQVMVPDEHGIIKTKFQSGENYGLVPGYTGYFSFEGDYANRMDRFRVKGFEQHLTEQLTAKVQHQMTRPFDKTLNNIPTTLDASGLNGLYHGDVYGKRIDLDFMETSQLNTETKEAILKTLSNRVRFDNQFSEHATTSAETQQKRGFNQTDTAAFSYLEVAGGDNMRVLREDIENYADLTMTGTGKTQGLIWYLTDGAKVNPDGSVTPSEGYIKEDGTIEPDKTALKKLSYFDKEKYNAWDRTQMAANQLMTAQHVDEGVGVALMSFGGWTFDDSYAVSKEFAERNKVFGEEPNEESMRQLDELLHYMSTYENVTKEEVLAGTGMMWSDEVINKGLELREKTLVEDRDERAKNREAYQAFLEEHGRFRPLQRGDKISDFGGNKGTIGIVIDRSMSDEEAKKQNLLKEVRFMRANPDLDVIGAPYSMLSRHNAGVVKELMDGETKDLVDPDTGEVYEAAMGRLNIIVTDMQVDKKTHAYTREDVLDGKGRKASGQLAWALQSKGAKYIMNEIYGHNEAPWATYREYLIATGLDMKPDGTIVNGYTPHPGEDRHHFSYDPDVNSVDFLDKIKDQGGFLDVPFDLTFKNGQKTNSLPVLSSSLRQNVELVDGSMRRSDFTNRYANIYKAVGDYLEADSEEKRIEAQKNAQRQFDAIQSTIIDRQFNGGHNGKHSFLRDKIMGKRMPNSATGVAIVDPRLDIGEAAMNQKMMDALGAKEGDVVMAFRDPIWRDGAIRAMTVVKDDTVHGIAINPIADKSHDMDFDGDTMGIIKLNSDAAIRDLKEKFSHYANMIEHGTGKDNLYFQTGMDLASAEAKAEKMGDDTPKKLYETAQKKAMSNDPRVQKQALKALNQYSHKMFREYGFGSDYVSLKDDQAVFESFNRMVEHGAKGSPKKLETYKAYHNGQKTMEDAREIQYATGVKSDDTGLAGGFSQKLVSVMRNENITAALEAMYPVTQGTLQIKHDANKAKDINKILTDDLNKTFNGKNRKNPKQNLTPNQFKKQLTDIFNELEVDVNEKYIDAVTDVLTVNNQIVPLKEAVALKGSPMDRVAYGGGYEELKRLAERGESLLSGEQNKLFAPYSMRYADEKTKLAKRDTQRSTEEAAEEEAARMHPKMEPKQLSLFEDDAEFAL